MDFACRVVLLGCVSLIHFGIFAQASETRHQTPEVTDAEPAVSQPNSQPTGPNQTVNVPKRADGVDSQAQPTGTDGSTAGPATANRESPPAVRVRQGQPDQPPNLDELAVGPQDDGRIQFSFQGQAWPDVLEWFAKISHRTLDWQELPGDYLNLTVRRRYTLDEARDLLNRHLLARGFTLLEHGEGFSVVKIEKINPAMVPRVRPDELDDHFPHEFVKVLFQLDWLLADDVVKELEALKSPHGRLVALTRTNRLEAMDAVGNLRDLYRLLQAEQSSDGRHRLVREFALLHVRAAEIQSQLEDFLGIERKERAPVGEMTPQQMAQLQQQAQMQAQMQAQQGGGAPQAKPKAPVVRLTADSRRNTLIVHAPPDKMAIVESFIELVDVPSGRADSLDAYLNRMKVYRLASLDPEQFVKSLEELGGLQPTTRVRADRRNQAILVDASLVDHFTIKSLIDKLDGSGRRFEVITLRKHPADEVAGSIEFLMGANSEEKPSPTPRYFGYSPFGMGSDNSNESANRDKFRVGSNVESNQLLLWANEIEFQEIEQLLIKLGEGPTRRGNSQVRALGIPWGDDADEIIRQLERIWPGMSPNPLILPRVNPPSESPSEPLHQRTLDSTSKPKSEFTSTGLMVSDIAPIISDEALTELERSEILVQLPPPSTVVEPARPPVRLGIGPDGNLVISSEDLTALDLLEQWLLEMAPDPRPFEVFRLRNASAYWVKLNLEDYFKEEKTDRSNDLFNSWYWGIPQPTREKDRRQLGKRRPVRFIHDYDTNTILVQGADRGQLKVIAELIELYDVPEPATSQSMRVTKLFHVKYSRAEVIAETIKDAYRDLLSSNDKALQAQQQQQGQRSAATIIRSYGPPTPGGDEEPERKTQVSFKGKLSLGVDVVTNTLLVSTEGDSLMNTIGQVIEALDKAAHEEAYIEVRELSSRTNGETLAKTLAKLLEHQRGEPSQAVGPPPPQVTPTQPPVIVSGF